MRFERIRAERFGPIEGWDTGEGEILPGLVVVLGPNEAGKSSVHQLLTSLLYGFYPASREANPFSPWGGNEIDIRGWLRADGGGAMEVHRRLLSTPQGELTRESRVESLANRDLPEVGHIPRATFQHLYALTLADLAGLDTEGRGALADRLVVGMGASDLISPREVIEGLRSEAGTLWRADRRGSPEHTRLQTELTELRARLRAARERDGAARGALRRMDEIGGELAELEAGSREVERRRRVEGGLRRLVEELRELEKRREELAADLAALEERSGEVADEDRILLDLESRVAELLRKGPGLELREGERARLDSELKQIEGELEAAAAPLVEDPEHPLSPEPFLALPVGELGEAVRLCELEEAREAAAREAREGAEGVPLPTPPGAGALRAGVGAAAAGAGLLLAGWLSGAPLLLAAGAGLALAGAGLLFRHQGRREAYRSAAARKEQAVLAARSRLEERGRELERLRDRVRRLLDPLPLALRRTERPGAVLAEELGRVRTLLLTRSERLRARTALEVEDDRLSRELEALRSDGIPSLPQGPGRALVELEIRLRDALGRREKRERDLDALAARRRELVELERRDGVLREERAKLVQAIGREAGDEEWDAESDENAVDREMEGLRDRERVLRDELAALRAEVTTAEREETPDTVESMIELNRERTHEVRRERDRLTVLAALVERAERRFREAHQPDLIRRAGEHLAGITGGRYSRLLIGEGEEASGFHVHLPESSRPHSIEPPLSTGTREQIYTALRLAIVDHLDEGHETLPLFLDEVLVNWDADRRARGLELMAELAGHRQIFLFTCHPEIAAEVEARGGRRLVLPGPR